jgi:hypothetical protein
MMKSALARGPVLALALFAALGGCATRQEVPLPTAADYGRSCTDLVTEFQRADAAAVDRKSMARKADISLGTSAIVLAATVAAHSGIAIPFAAIAIQQSRSDFGYSRFAQQREHYRTLAVRKGCTQEMAELKPAVPERTAPRSIQGTGAVPFVFGGN